MREKSVELFKKAKQLFPGGVNSPVRAFKSVGGQPLFMVKGDGSKIWDADGNKYIDFCCSWGPLIHGHNNPLVKRAIMETVENGTSFGTPTIQENELGELIISNHRFIEKIRFVSSGTEATMSALRLARGITGRSKIIKFEGCYHGHSDGLLVKAGSGLATFGTSSSAGVPEAYAAETIVLPLNDAEALHEAFSKYKDEIAAVIIEPIPANNGLLLQDKTFLKLLREVCTDNCTLLIFDEVISGFRIGFEGAAGFYDIQPDIITFGKIIGGGLPVGAYGASEKFMSFVSPDGGVYQAGTLSGNPVAMAAGYAQLSECLKKGFYQDQEERTATFVDQINNHASKHGYAFRLFQMGSIFWLSFSDKEAIRKASDIGEEGVNKFTGLFNYLLENGLYLGPSAYEVGFVSSAHTKEDLDIAAKVMRDGLDKIFA